VILLILGGGTGAGGGETGEMISWVRVCRGEEGLDGGGVSTRGEGGQCPPCERSCLMIVPDVVWGTVWCQEWAIFSECPVDRGGRIARITLFILRMAPGWPR